MTDPNGHTLLSTDAVVCRQAVVAANASGKGVVYGVPAVTPAECTTGLHAVGSVNATNGSLPVQLIPFLNTPNNGGEYKVWLISQDSGIGCGSSDVYPDTDDPKKLVFPSNCAKTDNFKVKEREQELPQNYILSGKKFYDANNNNVLDGGEQLLEGWTISISGDVSETTTTGPNGDFSFLVKGGSAVTICEILLPGWTQTYPQAAGTVSPFTAAAVTDKGVCWSGTVPHGDVSGLDFGNNIQISGKKFYDKNVNTLDDDGMVVAGIKIMIANCAGSDVADCSTPTNAQTVYTDAEGKWSAILLAPTQWYIVNEVLPPASTWMQTFPTDNNGMYIGEVGAEDPDQKNLCFGNVCLGAGGGKTLGFWSNKNGQALVGADDLTMLRALNLRNADGTDFDPGTYVAFRTWILGATATNMANMLSAQLAAMKLNVFNGLVDGSAMIYAPGATSANTAGFASVADIIAEADAELGLHGLVLSDSPYRSYHEALKNALDKANNNLTFVQATPCPVAYPLQ